MKIVLLGATLVAAVGFCLNSYASYYSIYGTACVPYHGDAVPNYFQQKARNYQTSIQTYYCNGQSDETVGLARTVVYVVDQSSVGAVECTGYNGAFTASDASVGNSSSLQTLELNFADSTFVEASVVCTLPAKVGTSGMSAIETIAFDIF